MKTLYVSDLDGTLLRSNEKTSDYTNSVINDLVRKGMVFSYATARSYVTSHKVTEGMVVNIPLITYNGAMIINNADGTFLRKNFFGTDVLSVVQDLFSHGIYPIVYSFIEGEEKFSYCSAKCTEETKQFVDTRRDARNHPVEDEEALLQGEIFYITCIGDEKRLAPLYEKYKDVYHCVFQRDIYSGAQWFEILPAEASKANAIRQLREQLDCDKLVVFGDGKNDIDMFEMADESYAVENAVQELKDIATGVITDNDSDGVARFLSEHFGG